MSQPQGSQTNAQTGSKDGITSSISMMTMIHIGVEILVVAGVSFWLHSKIKTQEEHLKIQADRIAECEKLIAKQTEIITRHENALHHFSSLLQGLPAPQTNRPQNPTSRNTSRNNTPQHSQQQHSQQRVPQQKQQPPKGNTKVQNNPKSDPRRNVRQTMSQQQSRVEEVESEEEAVVTSGTEDSGDIDEMLQDEINDLDSGTRVECNDDECEVVPPNMSRGNFHNKKK